MKRAGADDRKRKQPSEFDVELDSLSEWLSLARKARANWVQQSNIEVLRVAYCDGIHAAADFLKKKGHPQLARDVKKLAPPRK